jgi:hypothetical protein
MLCELQHRPGKEEFATAHLGDLFLSALNAGDKEVIDKIKSLIPEDDLFWTEADRLRYKLIEKPDLFDDLEAICKKAVSDEQEPHEFLLLELSYVFEKILPGMSIIFGRAAIASEPDRWFDNSTLMEVIEQARISVGLEPWGDPIEEYLEWTSEQIDQRFTDTTKDQEILELQNQLAETKKRSSAAFKKLRQTERELNALSSQQQSQEKSRLEKAADSKPVPAPAMQTPAETVSLKRKIDRLKDEIREQQADRRRWRQEAKKLRQELVSSEEKQQKAPDQAVNMPDTAPSPLKSANIQLPEFTRRFRKSCESLPGDIAAKAAQAAVGFGVRDQSILQQSLPLEARPYYYRIRIGIHYRLLLRQAPGENLRVLDIVARENLKTWIRKHL